MERTEARLLFLDHMRGIAILAVFSFHCLGSAFGQDQLPWGAWFSDFSASSKSFLAVLPATFGWAGVAIFFVVSGFCIHLSFLRRSTDDWRGFYVRRFFRIYPPYFLTLIVFAVAVPTTRLSFHSLFDWAQLCSHLLLLQNFDERSFFGINPVFWTIAIEVQLYLLYPALLALAGKIGWRRALIAIGSLEIAMRGFKGVVIAATAHDVPQWFSGAPPLYWYSWAIGAAVAEAFVRKQSLPFRSLPAGALFLLAIGVSWVKPLFFFSFVLFAVLTATMIARLLERGTALPLPRPFLNHLRILGGWSYSFYLLHQPLIAAVPGLFRSPVHPLVMFAYCVCTYPLILAASWLSYRYCEQPGIAFGKLFLRKASKDAVQPGSPTTAAHMHVKPPKS